MQYEPGSPYPPPNDLAAISVGAGGSFAAANPYGHLAIRWWISGQVDMTGLWSPYNRS